VALLVAAPQTAAHSASTYFPRWWNSSTLLSGSGGVWLFADSGLTAQEQSRVSDARRQWNDQAPNIWYDYRGVSTYATGCSNLPRNRNPVVWRYLDGPVEEAGIRIATTSFCFDASDQMDAFWTAVDFNEVCLQSCPGGTTSGWYSGGAASGIGPGQFDYWSVLAHEFGHGMGFGSYRSNESGEGLYEEFSQQNQDQTACPTSTRSLFNTMCSPPNAGQRKGETFWRDLATHDIHTFDNRYPP
jgi:hypothetical protein